MLRFITVVALAATVLLGVNVVSATAAPANDNFANRQAISGALPITVAANNIGATTEAGEPGIASNPPLTSVWFSWTAPAAGAMVVDLCDAGFTGSTSPFISMGVWTGNSLATLASVKETGGQCLLRFNAIAANTYAIQIDYRNNEGNFNLKLRKQNPPVNDNFASAIALGPSLPLTRSGTTVDSTYEAGEPPSLGGASQSRSVWYRWTAPDNERVRLTLCDQTFVDGALNDRTVVYTGATLATLTPVADLTSNDCVMDFPVSAGITYRIAVSGYIQGEFDFVIGLSSAPPPGNDNFANPQLVSSVLPAKSTGNNDFATEEAGEPNHGGYPDTSRSVWFSWTAPESGRMRLKACSRDLELFSSVYTGALLSALTEVGERFYFASCSNFFDAVAGTTYRIAVAGAPFSSTHGPFDLEIHRVRTPTNDNFDSIAGLGSRLSVARKGTTVDATLEDFEPSHNEGYSNDYGGSVWYRWTAPNDNAVILSACSQIEPNLLSVFNRDPEAENPGIQALRLIDSDAEGCRNGTKGGRLAIAPVKGEAYFIGVVADDRDYEAPFTLRIKGTRVSKPKPPFNLKKAIAKCRKIKGKGARAKRKRSRCIKAARKRFK